MENLSKTKVGKIVATNYRAASIFSTYHIDFCCQGGITLEEACHRRQIPLDTVAAKIRESLKAPNSEDYQHRSLDDLINLIVNVHHKYVVATAPALLAYLEKLCARHGDRHPELHSIMELFGAAASELETHMQKEELVLFPYIRAMVEAQRNGFPLSKPYFGDIENPIQMMEREHANEGERFQEIAQLSGNYDCPADGCQTYIVAYAMLKEFEDDLHKHIHLENNILFPGARELFNAFNN